MTNSSKYIACIVISIFSISYSYAQDKAPIINYYSTPDTLNFDATRYRLAWSSHPNEYYYKHEYLLENETFDHITKMILLEFLKGDFNLHDVVANKIYTLRQRKQTDKICNYEVIKSRDGKEYIIDFIISGSEDGKLNIVEWDCYRYKLHTDSAGHMGVLLLGVSYRGFGDDSMLFLKSLPEKRKIARQKMMQFEIPNIQIE
ncbi:hypothetical protein CKK33_05945 [Mucilaginibacter sp. MD40]|uniref:hypothetical protein n=1 Tax=Mucilaginibacter sp. MD40 TaxID=2029590 RepID=UPI000BAC5890|nr:hypothetical protein [Mucilaginibacter sp. MD40]PAW93059.1 hypothetical protein CKK33_05945 [Mucilaginibacter sp. MD40]